MGADPVLALHTPEVSGADVAETSYTAFSGNDSITVLTERPYSGKFNLRVGEALHRRLAIEAAEEQVSINQLIVRRLSAAG